MIELESYFHMLPKDELIMNETKQRNTHFPSTIHQHLAYMGTLNWNLLNLTWL